MNFAKMFGYSVPLGESAGHSWCYFISSGSTDFQQSTLPILIQPTHFTPAYPRLSIYDSPLENNLYPYFHSFKTRQEIFST